MATGLEKVSFHSNPKEGKCQRIFKLLHNCTHLTLEQSNAQNSPSQASSVCELSTSGCSNYCTIALISHSSKVMLKILQARLQQNINCELSDVQAGFRKGRGTRDQITNFIEKASLKKQGSSRKTSISALLTMPKNWTMWITIQFSSVAQITINFGKF